MAGSVRHVPTRTCVACRTPRSKRELVRIVRTPAGDLVADETGRVPGRGAYVCRSAACLTIANTKGALTRALHTPVPATLLASIDLGTATHDTIEGGARGQE
ncbi:MAG: RNase P modulator RnpM [Candidatus Limnocylindria bacterium]